MSKVHVKRGLILESGTDTPLDYSYTIKSAERHQKRITLFRSRHGGWTEKYKGKPCTKLIDDGNDGVELILDPKQETECRLTFNYSQLHELYILLDLYRDKKSIRFQKLPLAKRSGK